MRIETALSLLRRDPQSFLRNNLLVLAGGSRSGVLVAGGGTADPPPTGGPGRPNEAFKMSGSGMAYGVSKSDPIQVHNCRMIPKAEPLALATLEAYLLDGGGPDIMITGQLTKCSFVALREGNNAVVAHVEPGGLHADSGSLHTDIEATGAFVGRAAGFTRVFAFGRDYQTYAYVVGVRVLGQWQIWAQIVNAPGTNSMILSVDRII